MFQAYQHYFDQKDRGSNGNTSLNITGSSHNLGKNLSASHSMAGGN